MHHAPCPPALPHAHTWVYARVWLLVLALELELEFERPLSGCFFFFFFTAKCVPMRNANCTTKNYPGTAALPADISATAVGGAA
jgi:hypothetical protein